MKRLAIFGASGHGKVVADIAELCGWEIFFFDDAKPKDTVFLARPLLGNFGDLLAQVSRFDSVVVAVGNNDFRLERSRSLGLAGAILATLIHPAAIVSRYAQVEPGSVIMPGAVINAAARIGQACIVNTGATIDHDCRISDGAHISPGANLAGSVFVGECGWVGIGASVRQQVCIGARSVVAAGAVVVKDVEDCVTVGGVPAIKIIG